MMIAFVSLPTMYGIKGLGFSHSIVNIDDDDDELYSCVDVFS